MSEQAQETQQRLAQLLGGGHQQGRRQRLLRWALWAGLAVVLLVSALQWRRHQLETAQPRYTTEAVTRGRLALTVTATGSLQPTDKVDVGSELSGTVVRVHVRNNDQVRQGQLLAELDTTKLEQQIDRARAALDNTRAKLRQAEVALQDSSEQLQRMQEADRLSGGQTPSRSELASAQTTVLRHQAELLGAGAALRDAQAALALEHTQLAKSSLRAPLDGVVLARNVEPGNSVAVSLQAVTLFTLARDLKRMKLAIYIDEADVAKVAVGQAASFTVSAYANRPFPATIAKVSWGSTTKDNVVTYVAELDVPNNDLALRPGMTATAVISTQVREQVLLVPNSALRFAPEAPVAAGDKGGGGLLTKLLPRPASPLAPRRSSAGAGTGTGIATLWVVGADGGLQAQPVATGLSDGRHTEVSGAAALQPGLRVATDQLAATAR